MDRSRVARLVRLVDQRNVYAGSEIEELLLDLETLGARGLDRLLGELERATRTPAELRATVREAVYARFLARNGGIPEFEPNGAKGPDLGLECSGDLAYLEIKRLLEGAGSDVESWYHDETLPDFEPQNGDRLTEKLLNVVKGAASQLVEGRPNVVVLSDWSLRITRGNFRRAMAALEQDIADNGTYHQISAVIYDSNNDLNDGTLTWMNPSADVPLVASIRSVLNAAANDQSRGFDEAVQRAIARSSSVNS